MNPRPPFSALVRPATSASLLALSSLLLAACFGMGSKKGHSGLVVSSVDPAAVANAGQSDRKLTDPVIRGAGISEAVFPDDGLDIDAEPAEAPVRTEITGGSGDFKEYMVKKGDSLWSIGREFGVGIDALRRANGMSGDKLVAGKAIRIPGSGDGATGEGSGTDSDSEEVVATLPKAEKPPVNAAAEEEMPETLPSGVVAPDPPRRPGRGLLEGTRDPEDTEPVTKPETTIGDDGFLRFGDEDEDE